MELALAFSGLTAAFAACAVWATRPSAREE